MLIIYAHMHWFLVIVKGVIKHCQRVNFGPHDAEEHCLISLINGHKHIKDKSLTSGTVNPEIVSLCFH